jgi:release factor glutamine methyltransferase
LLGYALGMSKTGLYTEPERPLTSAETECLRHLIQRRLDHEPTAYIIGHCQFYGIDFCVDPRVLIPRPETELLVEKAAEVARCISDQGQQIAVADIGTGCGAIAVSLALALPGARVYATDISSSALQVAEVNCRRHGVDGRVELLHGNLLEPLPQGMDMIVANLPYVRDCELLDLSPEIREHEPTIALAGGRDGLDEIRELLEQMRGRTCTHHGEGPIDFLLEIGQGQGEMVTSLISDYFPQAGIELISDLGGFERVLNVMSRVRGVGSKKVE